MIYKLILNRMSDENTSSVGTTQITQDDQAVTSQSGKDFVLDFGDGDVLHSSSGESVDKEERVDDSLSLDIENAENKDSGEDDNSLDISVGSEGESLQETDGADFDIENPVDLDVESVERKNNSENTDSLDITLGNDGKDGGEMKDDFDISLDDSESGQGDKNDDVENLGVSQNIDDENSGKDLSLNGENSLDSENESNMDISVGELDNVEDMADLSKDDDEIEDDNDKTQSDIYDELDSYGELDFDDDLVSSSDNSAVGEGENISQEENLDDNKEDSESDVIENLNGVNPLSEDKTGSAVEDGGKEFDIESVDGDQDLNNGDNQGVIDSEGDDVVGNLQEIVDENVPLSDGNDGGLENENSGVSDSDNVNLENDGDLSDEIRPENNSGDVENSQDLEGENNETELLSENQSDLLDKESDDSLETNLLNEKPNHEVVDGEPSGNQVNSENENLVEIENSDTIMMEETEEPKLGGDELSSEEGSLEKSEMNGGVIDNVYDAIEGENMQASDENDMGMSFDLQSDSFEGNQINNTSEKQDGSLDAGDEISFQNFDENKDEILSNEGNEQKIDDDSQSDSVEMKSTLSLDEILDSELNSGKVSENVQNSSVEFEAKSEEKGKTKRMFTVFAGVGLFLMIGVVAYLAFPDLLDNFGGDQNGKEAEEHFVASETDNQFPEVNSTDSEENIFDGGNNLEIGNDGTMDDGEDSLGLVDNSTKVGVEFPSPVRDDEETTDDLTWIENNSDIENSSKRGDISPYIGVEEGSTDIDVLQNMGGDQVTFDDIDSAIASFRNQGEGYYSIAQENSDRHIYKYAVKILSVCDDYEQRVSNGEGIDDESYEAFKSEVNNLLTKINEYNGRTEVKTIDIGSDFENDSYFTGKDEYLDYIYGRENN